MKCFLFKKKKQNFKIQEKDSEHLSSQRSLIIKERIKWMLKINVKV